MSTKDKVLGSITIIVLIIILFMTDMPRSNNELSYLRSDGTEFAPEENVVKQIVTVEHVVYVPEECVLSQSQYQAVKFSIDYAAEHDLSYTLAAIALKESNAGRWKVNIQDPSGGLYHVTLDKVLTHFNWEDTGFNRNRAMQRLVDDDELAAELAVKEILFWRDYNAGNWLDTWANYNAGTLGKHTERGKKYAEDIRQLIVKIKQCEWDKINAS